MLVRPHPSRATVSTRRCAKTTAGSWAWPAVSLALLLGACASSDFDWQGRSPAALREYHAAFDRGAGSRCDGGASLQDFVALANSRRALFVGDHHRDEALHVCHRELLRELAAGGRKVVLLLEAIGIEDQPAVDDYLAGRIGMEALSQRCRARWDASWLAGGDVDVEHYRELLRIARHARIEAFGLEPAPRLPLAQRDARIAAQVRAVAAARPEAVVVVVVGQSHLLGEDRVAQRAGLSCVVVGAEPSPQLLRAWPARSEHELVRTDRDVWFFASGVGAARAGARELRR